MRSAHQVQWRILQLPGPRSCRRCCELLSRQPADWMQEEFMLPIHTMHAPVHAAMGGCI